MTGLPNRERCPGLLANNPSDNDHDCVDFYRKELYDNDATDEDNDNDDDTIE